MNKKIFISFFLWVLLSFIGFVSFLFIINLNQKDTISNILNEIKDNTETYSWTFIEVTEIVNDYQTVLQSDDPSKFLTMFQNDYVTILDSIQKGNKVYYDIEKMDVYVPFLVRCNILSENMSDISNLKAEIWKSLAIFLIDNSAWIYPNDLVNQYNDNFKSFSTIPDYTISELFNTLNGFEWKFENTDNDFANNLGKLYSQFYKNLQENFLNNTKINCENFFKENVFWLGKS